MNQITNILNQILKNINNNPIRLLIAVVLVIILYIIYNQRNKLGLQTTWALWCNSSVDNVIVSDAKGLLNINKSGTYSSNTKAALVSGIKNPNDVTIEYNDEKFSISAEDSYTTADGKKFFWCDSGTSSPCQ